MTEDDVTRMRDQSENRRIEASLGRQRSVYFTGAMCSEIIAFAKDRQLTFSGAIALLCREALDARKEPAR